MKTGKKIAVGLAAALMVAMIAAGAGLSNLSAFVRRNRRKYVYNHQ